MNKEGSQNPGEKRMERRQEKIMKIFEEFLTPPVSAFSAIYSLHEQVSGLSNENCYQTDNESVLPFYFSTNKK